MQDVGLVLMGVNTICPMRIWIESLHRERHLQTKLCAKRKNFSSGLSGLGVTGEDLLKALTPISEDIDSNETVEFNGQLFNKSDLTEETLEWLEWYNS